jgi:uncharacterized membrane protein YeiH
LAPALLVQHFHPLLTRIERVIDLADAVWLGLFSVAGPSRPSTSEYRP